MISLKKDIVLFDKKENCCGCWACENICPKNAIKMHEDKEGFLFPSIDRNLCVGCGLCEKVCPVKKQNKLLEEKQKQPHIKIINFSSADNYGAVIAGACLEHAVRTIVDNRHIVETIAYDTSYIQPSFKNKLAEEAEVWMTLLRLFLRKLHIISDNAAEPEPVSHKKAAGFSPLTKHRYNQFRCDYLNMTPTENDDSLAICRDNIKALICGSDIIWHPNLVKKNQANAFYLNFGDKSVKRISFAASLDFADGEELHQCKKEYKKRLKNFDHISVRERCNVDFIQSVAPEKVHCCCDPVFLYNSEFFDSMISSSDESLPEDKYIYVYVLSHNEKIAEYAKKIAAEKGLKILYYSESQYDFGESGVNCSSDGPAEFLHRIKHAEYVITTSFHCVAFSLLFEKKFIAFRRDGMGPKIDNILEIAGLPERLIEDNATFDIDNPIDFENVRRAIQKEREDSLKFLKDSLS